MHYSEKRCEPKYFITKNRKKGLCWATTKVLLHTDLRVSFDFIKNTGSSEDD